MDDILLINPLEDRNWDRFVMDHPFGWITHLSGWKTVLEGSFAHMTGFYLVLPDHAGNRIKAALPLFEVDNWLTGRRLISTPFATFCDPLVSTREDMEKLTNSAIHLAHELGGIPIEIRTFAASSLITDKRFTRRSCYKTHYLQLDSNPATLFATFHRSCVRQKIQQAIKNNVYLKLGENEADLQQFYKLYVLTRKRLGLPPQPYVLFRMIWETFFPTNQAMLLFAAKGGEIIAGMILFKFKGRASAEYLASDLNNRVVHPDHFLFWEAIKLAYSEGYEFFDFGRTSLSNTTLDEFKSRWGTRETDLCQFFYPSKYISDGVPCEVSLGNRVARAIFRHFPVTALKCVGNIYYARHG